MLIRSLKIDWQGYRCERLEPVLQDTRMVRVRFASEDSRQVLPVVVCIAHVVHDHLAKVGLLRKLTCAVWCLLLGRFESCCSLLSIRVLQCFLEGPIQALLVFTYELTEELIITHVLSVLPHDIPVIVLHNMLANHRRGSVFDSKLEVHLIDGLSNLVLWKAA